ADAIERLHYEVGVAQPAITVIPGAAGSRRFGNRGGVGRDDAAGLLEVAELQRDRGADNFVLPVVRNGQAARPIHPIIDRAVAEFAAGGLEIVLKTLVDAEHEMQRTGHDERSLALDVGQRRIGGEADDAALMDVADMIAAKRAMGERVTGVVGRPEPYR